MVSNRALSQRWSFATICGIGAGLSLLSGLIVPWILFFYDTSFLCSRDNSSCPAFESLSLTTPMNGWQFIAFLHQSAAFPWMLLVFGLVPFVIGLLAVVVNLCALQQPVGLTLKRIYRVAIILGLVLFAIEALVLLLHRGYIQNSDSGYMQQLGSFVALGVIYTLLRYNLEAVWDDKGKRMRNLG